MNSKGRIYLQKRSKIKDQNPGLYDKTIGGHVLKGESWKMTVIRECAEELGFPSSVLSEQEFKAAIQNTDLKVVGILRKLAYLPNHLSTRITKNGQRFLAPYMTTCYLGFYDGAMRFVDGESSGIEVFSLEELGQEIKNNPNKFTEDLKFIIKKYKNHLKPIGL